MVRELTPADTVQHGGARSDHRRVALVVGLLFGLAAMGSAASAIALPALAADMGLSTADSVWVISLYSLVLAVSTPLYGRIADRVGIRGPLMTGIAVMTVGAVFGAFAPNYELLLAARLLQGAGGGAVPTLTLAIVNARYDGPARAAALTRVAGVTAAVNCLGLLAGAFVADQLSWRAVIALPALGILVAPLLWRPAATAGSRVRLDVLGAALVACTAAGVILLVQSPSAGFLLAAIGGGLSLLGLPAVVAWVRRRPDGFLPKPVVTDRSLASGALAVSAVPAVWFALLIAIPTVLVAHGWELLQVGLALVPSAVVGLLAPHAMAPLLQRLGAVRALLVADVGALAGLLVAAAGAATISAAVLVAAVVVLAFAFSLGQPAMVTLVRESVADEHQGVALGLTNLVFLMGGGLGSAVLGGLGAVTGMAFGLLVLCALPVLGVVAMLFTVRRARAGSG